MDEVVLMLSPEFWKMIEARRKQRRTPLDEFERELAGEAIKKRARVKR